MLSQANIEGSSLEFFRSPHNSINFCPVQAQVSNSHFAIFMEHSAHSIFFFAHLILTRACNTLWRESVPILYPERFYVWSVKGTAC